MRIIGISGRARQGKDTVGKMICDAVPGARTIAFADPIKAALKEFFDWTDEHVSGALKEVGDPRYPTGSVVWKHIERSHTGAMLHSGHDAETGNAVIPQGTSADAACGECGVLPEPVFLTPRRAMQLLGTEFGRTAYPRVWIDHALRRAQRLFGEGDSVQLSKVLGQPGRYFIDPVPLVAITDCRFINEAEAIQAAGGLVWKVTGRGGGLEQATAAHASETEMDSSEFMRKVDLTIHNNGTLDELRALVTGALGRQVKDWEGR